MLSVDNVSVYRGRSPILHNVSFVLPESRTLAVVGESGAGKSTLIAAVLGLIKLERGNIKWNEANVSLCRPSLVMQEPRAAFNPSLSVRQTVLEPIMAAGLPVPTERLHQLCQQLELPIDLLNRKPFQISIGQAQRAGILRALIHTPPLVLFDEPLSALDAVTQKHTAQLIAKLQTEHGFAALVVTHDLGYAAAFADDIAVLRAGRIEELTTAREFVREPQSDYGRLLRNAAIELGALEQAS